MELTLRESNAIQHTHIDGYIQALIYFETAEPRSRIRSGTFWKDDIATK